MVLLQIDVACQVVGEAKVASLGNVEHAWRCVGVVAHDKRHYVEVCE